MGFKEEKIMESKDIENRDKSDNIENKQDIKIENKKIDEDKKRDIKKKNFEFKKRHFFLIAIFFIYFFVRIFYSLQSNYFEDDNSYFSLRQIDTIIEKGKPVLYDDLSYSGRTFYFMPFYYYLMALITKFFLIFLSNIDKIIILKILNNFFASLIVFPIYLIISHIEKNRNISLICTFLVSTFPLYIIETINKLNIYSIFFPLLLFLTYVFIKLDLENTNLIIFLSIVLVLTSQYSMIFLIGFLIYYLLSYIENTEVEKIKIEFFLFFLLFFFWANFIIFKNGIIANKINFLWQNIPELLLSQYFNEIDIYSLITNIGLLQIFFGVYTIYNYLVNAKNKNILFIISLFFSTIFLSSQKIIPYRLSIISLSILNILLFGIFWSDFFSNFKKTKLFNHEYKVYIALILGLIIFQAIPTIFILKNKDYDYSYYENYKLLKNIENSTILGLPEDGHLITYFGNKKNIIDNEFLGISEINEITKDIFNVYNKNLKIENLNILNKYNSEYILFSKFKEKYNITKTDFIDSCFDIIIKEKNFELYKQNKDKCKIQTIN
ncbi:MAG: hypothetical protein QXR96_00940 [Candidatus Woesearchaeota archaeon]